MQSGESTHWSLVFEAANSGMPGSKSALDLLCARYWKPVYRYIRGRGCGVEESQDLTQAFFLQLLEKNYLKQVDPDRGRFRSFLFTAVKHFVSHEREYKKSLKRGGAISFVPFPGSDSEWADQPASTNADPERAFDRQWSLDLLASTLARLSEQYRRSGQLALFDQIKGCLPGGSGSATYAEIGSGLGMSEGAVKVAVHRMRARYRSALRNEVLLTVEKPELVDAEIKLLLEALSS